MHNMQFIFKVKCINICHCLNLLPYTRYCIMTKHIYRITITVSLVFEIMQLWLLLVGPAGPMQHPPSVPPKLLSQCINQYIIEIFSMSCQPCAKDHAAVVAAGGACRPLQHPPSVPPELLNLIISLTTMEIFSMQHTKNHKHSQKQSHKFLLSKHIIHQSSKL